MTDKGSDMREKLGDDVGVEGVEQAITDEETICYRDLIEHSRDLICTHDLEGRILFVNSAAVKISGYDLNSFLKKNIRDFLAPEQYSVQPLGELVVRSFDRLLQAAPPGGFLRRFYFRHTVILADWPREGGSTRTTLRSSAA